MNNYFKPSDFFTSKEEIWHFNEKGNFVKTTQFSSVKCPQCGRYEHVYDIGKIAIWCCANSDCLETRLNNAPMEIRRSYPINFIKHLKTKNAFACSKLESEGNAVDFYEKWKQLKEGKIKDIIVSGTLGVGKTACMYAALKEVCKFAPFLDSMFLTEKELYDRIRNSWEDNAQVNEAKILKEFCNVDVLFIDDLGAATKSNQGEWSKQILLNILDERLNSLSHRTIISTNLDIDSLEQVYDSRIADRLKFMKRAFIKGESLRKPFETNDKDKQECVKTDQG